MKSKNLFPLTILFFTLLILISIRFFHGYIFQIPTNNTTYDCALLSLFVIISIGLGFIELGSSIKLKSTFSPRGLLILSLTAMLILSVFEKQVGIDGSGIFVIACLIYLITSGKFYALNPIYLVVFAYPLLQFFGTIGTPKGFHFPEITYSFYIIPVAFSCFRFEKETLLKILRLFSRIMLIFIAFSVIYWYYNIHHFDVKIIDWLTRKSDINGIPAYKFVATWSGYGHPSYINLVLLPALMSILYLFYKKQPNVIVSKLEVLLFILGCFAFQLISESRVGFVAVSLILLVTAMYYLHLKALYFKTAFIFILIAGGVGLFILQNKVSGFLSDPVRKTDYSLAISYIKTHPWWGAGSGREDYVLKLQETKVEKQLILVHSPKTYVHNQLLGTMILFGIPGAIVLLILVIGLFWYAFKSRSYLLQLFMLMYFMFMFIEEPLYTQEGITRFMIFLALFIHISEYHKPVKEYDLFKWFSKSKST